MKILDCTLRDGGYYTNWNFNAQLVDAYIEAMNLLPVDYLEVGYRNNPNEDYLGKFGYTPVSVLKHLRNTCRKKIAVMLNEKSTTTEDLSQLLEPIQGLADMVRLAVDPKNIDRAIILAAAVKAMGFEVGFNVMYMSKWSEMEGFLPKLSAIDDIADLFCMVDSFGGIRPDEVKTILAEVRKYTKVPIGFHGHDNLQLGLINTVTAIDNGIDFVDATITGMGRGAGNLKMELLLTYLNKYNKLDVDFNVLGDVITVFSPLLEKYHWGTNLPYMLSGANNIPQKEVMDWVTNRVYSFNSIVRALNNRKNNAEDNAKYPVLTVEKKFRQVIIIGGGFNAIEHKDAIKEFVSARPNTAMIFATARHAKEYIDVKVPKFYCLVGSEGHRLTRNIGKEHFQGICILPPYPRTMGTEVPDYAKNHTLELRDIDFTEQYKDSVTTIALQLAMTLTDSNIYVIGYDGYPGNVLSEKEMALTNENKAIFYAYNKTGRKQLKSLTPSIYKELKVESVYQFI
ncbi:MAG: aldolase catalytic domain-containing protein [Prevotella sp.]|nr:aldolase catalytic domain-containing protein [Prevotella sp.]